MKLKRNCLFFNADTTDVGRSPDWGQELGQGRGYLMKEEGCSEILNGMVFNQIKDYENFVYGNGGRNYEFEIISIFNNVKIKVYDFEKEIHQIHSIIKPLILIITKEIKGTHKGRRTLKINKGFTFNDISNVDFYNEINEIIPNPWFGYNITYDSINTGSLTITIIKAPQPESIEDRPDIVYLNAKERKRIWNDLLSTYEEQYDSHSIISETETTNNVNNIITQNKIFYGAPGTGKSHKVKEIVKGKDNRTIKVTFHPEYDYTSFVGGYKPTMNGDNIKYEFVPQAFTNIYTKAWNDPENDYYLVIEEINRGNCAEIFGDIFQLLDRDSDYDITPSIELECHLKTSLIDENKGLENGKLKLPKNLTIYATMNTSDQSLFPMDSAFKRRWDWEYIPICYEEQTDEGDSNPSYNYTIDLGSGAYFKWNEFISKVNLNYIQQNPVLGMDKCIGNYFIKPKNGGKTIDVATFINKAIFYLWNDVFKDEKNEVFEENSSYEDFFPIQTKGIQKLKELLERIEVNINITQEDIGPAKDEVTS